MPDDFEVELARLRNLHNRDAGELEIFNIEDALICSSNLASHLPSPLHGFFGGVRDRLGAFVAASAVYRGSGIPVMVEDPQGRREDAETRLTGRSLYAGPLFFHYGHFLTESTARLWPALERRYDHIVFQAPPGGVGALARYQQEFFELLGISDRIVLVHRPTSCDALDVPEPASVLGGRAHRNWVSLFHAVREAALASQAGREEGPRSDDKIYVSRTRISEGVICGEEILEEKLRAAGFVILHPEEMPLGAQIRAFGGAKVVVGVAGSGMHNILYSGADCRAVIILRDRNTIQNFVVIDSVADAKTDYIFGVNEREDYPAFDAQGPFMLPVREVLSRLSHLGVIEPAAPTDETDSRIERRFVSEWRVLHARKRREDGDFHAGRLSLARALAHGLPPDRFVTESEAFPPVELDARHTLGSRREQLPAEELINAVAPLVGAKSCLVLGLETNEVFSSIAVDRKTACAPKFTPDPAIGADIRQMTCDEFFDLAARSAQPDVFDLVFIDGVHTFQQSLRDVLRSMEHVSEKGLIILDDAVPSDYFASLERADDCHALKEILNFADRDWMGDVYKTLCFIHDFIEGWNYATIVETGRIALLWRERRALAPAFASVAEIASLSYADLILHRHGLLQYAPLASVAGRLHAR